MILCATLIKQRSAFVDTTRILPKQSQLRGAILRHVGSSDNARNRMGSLIISLQMGSLPRGNLLTYPTSLNGEMAICEITDNVGGAAGLTHLLDDSEHRSYTSGKSTVNDHEL